MYVVLSSLKRYMNQRDILQKAKDVSLQAKKRGESSVDPRLIEEYLEEIVSMCQVSIKYNRHVRRTIDFLLLPAFFMQCVALLPLTSNRDQIGRYYHRRYLKERLHRSSSKDALEYHLQQQNPVSTKTFNGEHYFRVLHEMVGFYIRLEEFYMYETVAVAIKINEKGETLTSSVVDDVFYILQKCARRASETGSIQAVCALLHHVSNILSDHVLSFVQHELAEVSEEGFADILSKDSKESLLSWATAVNNAEIIFENVHILTRDIQEYLNVLFDTPDEWDRISNCLNDIKDTSQCFERCSHNSLKVFANTPFQSFDNSLLLLSSTSFELDDLDQEDHVSLDSWVQHLLYFVDHLLNAVKPLLVTSCFRTFLSAFEEFLALRIEVLNKLLLSCACKACTCMHIRFRSDRDKIFLASLAFDYKV